MATAISALPAATAPTGAETVPVVQGGTTSRTTLAAAGVPSRVKLTADTSALTGSLADVAGLAFSVASGSYYRFSFLLLVTSDVVTVGPRVGLTCPAATVFGATVRGLYAADGSDAEFVGALTTSGDSVTLPDLPATGTPYLVEVVGTILPSASGSVQVQAATDGGLASVVVKRASNGLLTQL